MTLVEMTMRNKIAETDERVMQRVKAKAEKIAEMKFFKRGFDLQEAGALVPFVAENIKKYVEAIKLLTMKGEEGTYRTAETNVRNLMFSVASEHGRDSFFDESMLYAFGKSELDIDSRMIYAADAINWEIISDIKGCETNPFDYLVELYSSGLDLVGFKNVDGKERFIVHFLLPDNKVGCYAHGDGEILWYHDLSGHSCKELKQYFNSRIIRNADTL